MLPPRLYDLASRSLLHPPELRSRYDLNLALSVLDAQDWVLLEKLKEEHPGRMIGDAWGCWGFAPFVALEAAPSGDSNSESAFPAPASSEAASPIEALVLRRLAARQDKDFALADELRKQADSLGFLLRDDPSGTGWMRRLT